MSEPTLCNSEDTLADTERLARALSKATPDALRARGENGHALHVAARLGYADSVERLIAAAIESGPYTLRLLLDSGDTLGKGQTALHLACRHGHATVVRRLAGAGANVDAYDAAGSKPLHRACAGGHMETVSTLLAAGADPWMVNPEDGLVPLFAAVEQGDSALLKVLLDGGVDPMRLNDYGDTALHQSAYRGHLECVRILLDAGARVNAPGEAGDSVLHAACRLARHEVLRLLLERGADPGLTNTSGVSALAELAVCIDNGQAPDDAIEHCLETLHGAGVDLYDFCRTSCPNPRAGTFIRAWLSRHIIDANLHASEDGAPSPVPSL